MKTEYCLPFGSDFENKNDASRNLEKVLQALEQAKQRVANEKKKQNEKKRKAEVTQSPRLRSR
ncbi:MAG: hypothetical protein K2L82_05280 [Lachnospiraceae bacterium]|nr:hypothetical protein [Lachnospiraceae bacterium]